MAEVKQTFTGDSSGLEKAYKDLAKEVVRLESQVKRLSDTSGRANLNAKQGHDSVSSSIKGEVRSLESLILKWGSVASAIALVNNELNENIRLSDQRAAKQSSFASGQASLALNTLDPELFKKASQDAVRMAADAGFPDLKRAQEAMGTAIASGAEYGRAKEAVGLALRLSARTPEMLDMLVGAGLDVSAISGASVEESFALSLKAGKFARVADPARQAKNLDLAIAGMAANRGDKADGKRATEESAELYAALNFAAKDPMGEQSRTAAQQLSKQMREFVEKGVERDFGGFKFKYKYIQEDPGTDVGRFQAIMSAPEAKKAFLDSLHMEGGYAPLVGKMMTPGTPESAILPRAQAEIDYDTGAVRNLESILKSGSPQLTTADIEGRSKAAEAKRDIEQTSEGVKAAQRRILKESFEQTRGSSGHFALDDLIQLKVFDAYQAAEFKGWMKPNAALAGDEIGLLELRKQAILGFRSESALTGQAKKDFDFLTEQQGRLGELLNEQRQFLAPPKPAAATSDRVSSPPAPKAPQRDGGSQQIHGPLQDLASALRENTREQKDWRQGGRQLVPGAGAAMNAQVGRHQER